MLVLTRKLDESVIVGADIEIKVLGVRGDQVSLGFSAPGEVSIYRKEVFDAIRQQNLDAVRKGDGQVEEVAQRLGEHLERSPPDLPSSG